MKPTDRDNLDELCQEELGVSLNTLLKLVPALEATRRLLTTPLAMQRFNGLMRSTSKEDPLDCTYVRKCVIGVVKEANEWRELMTKLSYIEWLLLQDELCKDE